MATYDYNLDDLSEYDLRTLGDNVYNFTRLKRLHASNLGWTRLDQRIGDLVDLQELILAYNSIPELPISFLRLSKLQRLYLNSNRLTQLPDDFGTSFPLLEVLNLSSNNLNALPESLGSLTSLKRLFIEDNPSLKELPHLDGLLALEEITLDSERFHLPSVHVLDAELAVNTRGGAQRLVQWFQRQPRPPRNLRAVLELADHIVQYRLQRSHVTDALAVEVSLDDFIPTGQGLRSLLSFAVAFDNIPAARLLIEMGADVNLLMPDGKTALWVAILNDRFDGSEMVRVLLEEGANPSFLFQNELPLSKGRSISMRYWLRRALEMNAPPEDLQRALKLQRLDKIPRIRLCAIGQNYAMDQIRRKLMSHRMDFARRQGKPLVLLFPGPPGHGKTWLLRNLARSVVGDENFLMIPCGGINDRADLFGGNLGGLADVGLGSEGRLKAFLEPRQDQWTIVMLDEFEKLRNISSALGWDQSVPIFKALLEPFQEGHLTVTDRTSGKARNLTGDGAVTPHIRCDRTVFVCTTNLGQDRIIHFFDKFQQLVNKRSFTNDDYTVIRHNLINPLQEEFFDFCKGIHTDVIPLARRFDEIIPFFPFNREEVQVLADSKLRQLFREYRSAPTPHRYLGWIRYEFSRSVREDIAQRYLPMEGASSIERGMNQISELATGACYDGTLSPPPTAPPGGIASLQVQGYFICQSPDDHKNRTIDLVQNQPSDELMGWDILDIDQLPPPTQSVVPSSSSSSSSSSSEVQNNEPPVYSFQHIYDGF